jgi:hypothetical protein
VRTHVQEYLYARKCSSIITPPRSCTGAFLPWRLNSGARDSVSCSELNVATEPPVVRNKRNSPDVVGRGEPQDWCA